MKDLVIIGGGGFAKEVLHLVQQQNSMGDESFRPIGFIDNNKYVSSILGLPVLGDDKWAIRELDHSVALVFAVGDSVLRKKMVQLYVYQEGFDPATLIHPSVYIAPHTKVGKGSIICEGTILTTDIRVGEYCILNLQTTVGHDTRIEDFVTISPGVNISGNVEIGAGSEVGTGAAILPGITLGAKCILGAGAVATRNLLGNRTYVGVPARELKK